MDGAVFCCHTDSRGAPTRLTDGQGRVAWAAAYAAYGQAHVRREGVRQPLRLPGQYHDEETGLHQNRWRPYDPSRGRYLSPDPLGLAGGLNLYAYAGNDPIGQADPLGLFPSLAQLIGGHLGPQAAQKYLSAKGGVTRAVLDHLGPLRRLLPPASPRPPDPAMSLAHPQQHLPPAPAPTAQAPQPQKAARHAPPHHAPPPARAAQSCAPPRRIAAPALPQPRSVTGFLHNVPGSLKGVGTGLLGLPKMLWDTGGDIGTSLSDGVSAAYHRAHGEPDLADAEDQEAKHADDRTREKLLNLVPFGGSGGGIAHYAEAGGDWAASLGQSPEVAAVMRQEGGAALHRANGYMADMAYQDPAGFALNLLPLAGRAAALSRLGKVADATEAASREAAAAGDAARASQLSERAARYRQAISLARGGKAGAAAARKLSAGGKASLAKGRAAVGKYRERRAGGDKAAGVRDAGDPLAPHTPGSLARGQAAAAGMRGKWHDQAHGRPAGQGQPALAHAGGGGGGATTHPIGRPGVMQMAGKGEVGENPSLTERIRRNRNLKTRPKVAPVVSVKKDYHTFDLAQKSKDFRKKTEYYGTSNVVVIEYDGPRDLNGNLPTVAVKSIPQGDPGGLAQIHSEPLGLLELEKAGVPLSKVTRVYTERAPCMSPRNYCATLLASELPRVPVYHSFEFGTTEESMAAGNAALEKELRILKKQTEAAEGLK